MNLYILKLKEGKYYIGTTNKDVTNRLQEHVSGRGSSWTRKYKVLKLEKTIENCDKYDEDKWTKIYMDRHGITNVRGGSYCEMNLKQESINSISREVNHANDRCLYCNQKGHFIRDCPKKMNISEKIYLKNLNYLNMSYDYESESDDEEYTIDEIEETFTRIKKEDGRYEFNGETYIWTNGMLWEESPHEKIGAKDGTIYDSDLGYIRPIKKKKAKSSKGKCNRCGRNSHYASKCYAKKHVKGYYL